jgi:polygalacturonase
MNYRAFVTAFLALLLTHARASRAAEPASAPAGPVAFDIRTFGAMADGKMVNTKSIQAAIDACSAAGGGTVVAAGGKFVTGARRTRCTTHLPSCLR